MTMHIATYLEKPVEQWIESLRDNNELVRRLAAYALGEIGSDASAAVPALEAALNDREPFVRVWAAASLTRVDPNNPAALATLTAGTTDEKPFVRSLAVWHLGRLGPMTPGLAEVLPSLRLLLNDADPSVRAETVVALQHLHGRGK